MRRALYPLGFLPTGTSRFGQVRRAPLGAAWVTDAAALTTALTPLIQTGIQAGGDAARAAAAAKARAAKAKKRAKAPKAPATAPEAPAASAWPAWLAPVAGLAAGVILVTVFLRPRTDQVSGAGTYQGPVARQKQRIA